MTTETTITASFTLHGTEHKNVIAINAGDWFGKCWILGISCGIDTTYFVVEADSATDAIDELVDSPHGEALLVDPSSYADYGLNPDGSGDNPSCSFAGNEGYPIDTEWLSIHGDDRTGFSGVLYHVPGWPVPVKPTDLRSVQDKMDERDQYQKDVASPGKFESCQAYVPYFWDAYLNGDADDDDGTTLTFNVTDEDRLMFPELEGVDHVYLAEDDNGFVSEVDAPEDVDDMSGRGDDSDQPIDVHDLDEFTAAYIETALWSSTDDNGVGLDAIHGPEDITQETLREMVADCEAFQRENAADIEAAIESGEVKCGPDFGEMGRAGHDFWLTRNGHGAGFWDGDWPEEIGKRLTDAAHAYGSVDLYVGDDGKIYA